MHKLFHCTYICQVRQKKFEHEANASNLYNILKSWQMVVDEKKKKIDDPFFVKLNFPQVARLMKYGNRLVFMRDLEKHQEDLSFTKGKM